MKSSSKFSKLQFLSACLFSGEKANENDLAVSWDWPPVGRLPGEVRALLSFLRGSSGTFHCLAPVSCSALIAYDSYGIFFLMPNTLGTLLIHTRRKANWLEVSSESCTEDGIH